MTTKWAMWAVFGAMLAGGACESTPVELAPEAPAAAAGAAGGPSGGAGGLNLADQSARQDAEKQAAFEAWLRAAWPTTTR